MGKKKEKLGLIGHIEYPDTDDVRSQLFNRIGKSMYRVTRDGEAIACGDVSTTQRKIYNALGYKIEEINNGTYLSRITVAAGIKIYPKIEGDGTISVRVSAKDPIEFGERIKTVKDYLDENTGCIGSYDYYTKMENCGL